MENRAIKWANKLTGDCMKRAIDTQKPEMCRLEKIATEAFVKIEKEVKQIIKHVPVYLIHFYMAFAKEIYKLKSRHAAETLINEVEILQEKWIKRGLDWQNLDKIKTMYVQPYRPGDFFLMDTSLLDGNDRVA